MEQHDATCKLLTARWFFGFIQAAAANELPKDLQIIRQQNRIMEQLLMAFIAEDGRLVLNTPRISLENPLPLLIWTVP